MKILLEAKERAKRSFKDIGAALGTDQCAAHGILKGRRASSFERLFRVSRFLGVDDEAFFEAWKTERGPPEDAPPGKYLSVIEAARYAGYSRGYIHKLLFDGKLTKRQNGRRGHVLIDRSELDTFINDPRAKRKTSGTLPPPDFDGEGGVKELLRRAKKASGKTFKTIGEEAFGGKSGYYVHSILRDSCRKTDITAYLKIGRYLDISDRLFFRVWRREKGYL